MASVASTASRSSGDGVGRELLGLALDGLEGEDVRHGGADRRAVPVEGPDVAGARCAAAHRVEGGFVVAPLG